MEKIHELLNENSAISQNIDSAKNEKGGLSL